MAPGLGWHLSAKACSLGVGACSQEPKDCRDGARLCRLALSSIFNLRTTGYAVGDRRGGRFEVAQATAGDQLCSNARRGQAAAARPSLDAGPSSRTKTVTVDW